ncbi:trypsin-like peptidase domain-containing protein [Candidatus Kaiserbacteria bacterium]|nr:trypsin-like peptidase domain-containing protein [Candidatus Kaiserbacteria bacterium]NCT01699.1 trypsin-like peptidase domain-containing protein [Candidatus Parcubacteria bacterium]
MHYLTDGIIFILTWYLAFTNMLATEIQSWLVDTNETPTILTEEVPETHRLSWLPSSIGEAIPNILLQSAEYQQAAVSGATGLTGSTTDEPLEAIVNIFCTLTTDDYIRTTTGTGFFIDPDGVIMTNAHVAQFLLFEATEEIGDTDCTIRSGNPAAPQYHAELLYIPPSWIQQNATVMSAEVPMGTGERDYALLYVSKRVDGAPLPAYFPALSFNAKLLPLSIRGSTITAAGYPATALLTNGPNADLIPQKATSTISELYTFGSNYADVLSISGSVVGAEGASGGPVLNQDGDVIGVIVTRGDDSTDGAGSLRAISLSHIERTLMQETGFSLAQNLSGNLPYRANIFAKTLSPFLLAILQQANY